MGKATLAWHSLRGNFGELVDGRDDQEDWLWRPPTPSEGSQIRKVKMLHGCYWPGKVLPCARNPVLFVRAFICTTPKINRPCGAFPRSSV